MSQVYFLALICVAKLGSKAGANV